MHSFLRFSAASLALMLLNAGCNNNDKDSKNSTPAAYACSVTRNGELLTCNQFQGISGSTLTTVQSECELRSSEGYSWAAGACPASTVGNCSLPASSQRPAPYTQYYYGSAFTPDVAKSMCEQQPGGKFN